MKSKITFVLNGKTCSTVAEAGEVLADLLRNRLRLTGTKVGCGIGECGACTVLLDGRPVNACLVLAASVDGREVRTIEGLAGKELDRLQQAFIEEGAVQCGFCTPGMLMSAKALLEKNPSPTRAEIRRAISGNLCRCTGYEKIIRAVENAADRERTGR